MAILILFQELALQAYVDVKDRFITVQRSKIAIDRSDELWLVMAHTATLNNTTVWV